MRECQIFAIFGTLFAHLYKLKFNSTAACGNRGYPTENETFPREAVEISFWESLIFGIAQVRRIRRKLATVLRPNGWNSFLQFRLILLLFRIDDRAKEDKIQKYSDRKISWTSKMCFNPINHGGGGHMAPPARKLTRTKNWSGPKPRAFGTFIII